jgi:hypothetical protein
VFRIMHLHGLVLPGAHNQAFQFIQVDRFRQEKETLLVRRGEVKAAAAVADQDEEGVDLPRLWDEVGGNGVELFEFGYDDVDTFFTDGVKN